MYKFSDNIGRVFYCVQFKPGMYLAVLFYYPGKKISSRIECVDDCC